MRLGVDVGGTFTDLVAVADGKIVTAKVPSVPADQSVGVLAALDSSGIDPKAVAWFAHGSTVATNALLERRGAHTALVTTQGFRDLVEIGRQNRPSLYDLTRDREPVLVPRELRFVVRERIGPGRNGGTRPQPCVEPLDEDSVASAAAALTGSPVEAVAVCLLFAFLDPAHERRVRDLLADALPGVRVTLSSDVLPEFREYERLTTTVADAYLTPKLGDYLLALAERAARRGLAEPLVMQSSGGVEPLRAAAAHAGSCLLSGPAAGVVGAAYVAGLSGHDDLLTFDMGGTSTDVAPVLGGAVQTTAGTVVGGVPVRLPAVDVHSVSAGGGSIAWIDEGGALRVGPQSAGAEPGPACYGHGGEQATVTDANLVLGHLADGARLGGNVVLDASLARAALTRLGGRLDRDAVGVAAGIVAVADAEMARALRVVSVQRGLDPRRFTLVAFGGAGGMHACALAEELGIRRVLVPAACGVLSALGLAVGDLRRDYSRGHFAALGAAGHGGSGGPAGASPGPGGSPGPGSSAGPGPGGSPGPGSSAGPADGGPDYDVDAELESVFADMERQARRDMAGAACRRLADCRYRGQSFELTVSLDEWSASADTLTRALRVRFGDAHEQRYGYRMDGEPVEVVTLRVTALVAGDPPALAAPAADPSRRAGRREVRVGDDWRQANVFPRAALGPGDQLTGPAIVEFAEATCVLQPGWTGRIDQVGTLVLERD